MTSAFHEILSDSAPEPFGSVFGLWIRLCDGGWAPAAASFRLEELEASIIPWSVLVDVDPATEALTLRFWGTERVHLIGHELTGLDASSIPDEDMRRGNIREYKMLIQHRQPMLFETPITTASGMRLTFRSIRLPLSDGGDKVARIYSALDNSAVTELHYEHYGTHQTNSIAGSR